MTMPPDKALHTPTLAGQIIQDLMPRVIGRQIAKHLKLNFGWLHT